MVVMVAFLREQIRQLILYPKHQLTVQQLCHLMLQTIYMGSLNTVEMVHLHALYKPKWYSKMMEQKMEVLPTVCLVSCQVLLLPHRLL